MIPAADDGLVSDLNELKHWDANGNVEWLVAIGGNSSYRSAGDVLNFLRAFLEPTVTSSVQCEWLSAVDQGCCSAAKLPAACSDAAGLVPLSSLAIAADTPLLEMLQERRINTAFQPVFEADGKTVWGYECLMRGVSLEGEVVSPAQILSWARAENLIPMLDRVCRETHLRNAAAKLPRGQKILINFIPTAIYEPAFCLRSTMKVVKTLGLDPADIVFEVVESERVEDNNHLTNIMAYYRDSGFLTALDDVGAGFSGLNLLASLNPNILKLDIELVQNAPKSPVYAAVVRGLAQIAAECNQPVVAEGIETEEQFNFMRDLGVQLFQGYLLGRPDASPVREKSEESPLLI